MVRKFAPRILRNASWITADRAAEFSKQSVEDVLAAVKRHGLASKLVCIGKNSYTLVDRAVLPLMSELTPAA